MFSICFVYAFYMVEIWRGYVKCGNSGMWEFGNKKEGQTGRSGLSLFFLPAGRRQSVFSAAWWRTFCFARRLLAMA